MTEAKKPEFPGIPDADLAALTRCLNPDIVEKWVADYAERHADACVAHATAPLLATIKRQQDLLDMALRVLEQQRIVAYNKDTNTTREVTPKVIKDAIAAIQAERKESWG